jgi:hydroxymethylbilane synthase
MTHPARSLRIGTRKSPMAMAQTATAADLLRAHHPDLDITLAPMTAAGDRHLGNLADIGGKGAWVRELDAALAHEMVDVTVSCAKDLPSPHDRPPGTVIGAVLARDEIRDAVVLPHGAPQVTLAALPPGAIVGTSAPRRAAQLSALRPDLVVKPIRGNANTRLSLLDTSGEYDALILAAAGLERIDAADRASELLPVAAMCPAAGAGIVVIEHREGDEPIAELLRPLSDPDAYWALTAEKSVLAGLQGNCQSAVAASAQIAHGEVVLRVKVWGAGKVLEASGTAPFTYAEQLGSEVAAELIAQGAKDLLAD